MRIAVLNWTRRRSGGIESYLHHVLPELARVGHELAYWHEVDAPSDREPIGLPDGTPHWCVAELGEEGTLRALRDWQPELIFTHGLLEPALEAKTLAVAPAVFFAHAYSGTCISGSKTVSVPVVTPCQRRFGPACLLHFYPRRCGGLNPVVMWREYRRQSARLRLLRRYRHLLTYSHHVREEYVRHGFAPDRVTALPYFLPPGKEPSSFALPLRTESPWRLLFLGRMDFLKGGQTLLKALPLAASALGRPLHLTFAGDGPQRATWEQEARRLQSRYPHITIEFLGWVGGDRVDALWNTCDLAVVPSLWPEPFGLVGPEAVLRGVPVAAFAVGGIPEWLKDGVNGRLAPGHPPTPEGLANAIQKCLQDPSEHYRLCRGAMTLASQYNAECHLSVLQDVLHNASNDTLCQSHG